MRFELAGSSLALDGIVLKFESDQTLDLDQYTESGYTHFDVICIGGGGGRGGGIDTENTGTFIKNYGGAGGGGGFHRIKGLLSGLPSSVAIVVGAGGLPGLDHASNPANTTDGGDGEASSFNGTTCRASGGKGGKRAQSNSDTVSTQAHGGEGGIGNSTIAGGGAAGGTAGIPTENGPGTPGTPGENGSLIANIGAGGGGGAGGVGKYGGSGVITITCNAATAGGNGSYNPVDLSVYSLGGPPTGGDTGLGSNAGPPIIPGFGGGAKATPLTGLPTLYGISGFMGIVVIRLSAE